MAGLATAAGASAAVFGTGLVTVGFRESRNEFKARTRSRGVAAGGGAEIPDPADSLPHLLPQSGSSPPFPRASSAGPRVSDVTARHGITSTPFVNGEGGYSCFRIPSLLQVLEPMKDPDSSPLSSAGTTITISIRKKLLLFAEARMTDNCADEGAKDIVMKESLDNGQTWSEALRVVVGPDAFPDQDPAQVSVGNAAPVQLSHDPSISKRHPGRIVLVFCSGLGGRWSMHSDDYGQTWSQPLDTRVAPKDAPNIMATGPPAGIQLRYQNQNEAGAQSSHNGRVVIPSYHFAPHLNPPVGQNKILDTVVHRQQSHLMVSDDDGDSFSLAAAVDANKPRHPYTGESQAVETNDGTLVLTARTVGLPHWHVVLPSLNPASWRIQDRDKRAQAISYDGGDSFAEVGLVENIPSPVLGCEGSIDIDRKKDVLFQAELDSHTWRTDLSLYWSQDNGREWKKMRFEDGGEGHFEPDYTEKSTGYSALVTDQTTLNSDEVRGLLAVEAESIGEASPASSPNSAFLHVVYEESDVIRTIMLPDRIVYRQVEVTYAPPTGTQTESDSLASEPFFSASEGLLLGRYSDF